MTSRIGILGGYGSTGRIVVEELAKLSDIEITVGGRDINKANAVLKSTGAFRTRAVVADAFDPESLKNFCRGVDIVINCTSPTCVVMERVAKAAGEAGAHYIDPGGYDMVYQRLQSDKTFASKDKSCLISAGLCPGITELLVQHMADQFDTTESVDYYMDGRAVMAPSVFEDMIHTFFPLKVGSFEGGTVTPRNKWKSKVYEFPKPIGKQRAVPMVWPEIERFAKARKLPHLGFHVAATLPFMAGKDIIHPMFKHITKFGAAAIKIAYDLEISRWGNQYMFFVESEGTKNGERRHITAKIIAKGNEHYRLTAVALAVAAEMILSGETARGVHFLADAVKPASFIERLVPHGLGLQVEEKTLSRS